jgi:hypothetical protein
MKVIISSAVIALALSYSPIARAQHVDVGPGGVSVGVSHDRDHDDHGHATVGQHHEQVHHDQDHGHAIAPRVGQNPPGMVT